MYPLKKTNLLIPVFLLLSTQTSPLSAFSFREMFDEMDHTFKNMGEQFKIGFDKQEKLSPEDQALINKQLAIVAKIKPEITKNDNGLVTITFPIDTIDKDKIELSLEHGLLHGMLPLQNGYFKFVVNPNALRYEYLVELNKEIFHEYPVTHSENSASTDAETKEIEKTKRSHTLSWKTANSYSESLPLEVDLSKTQSETKNNKLFIRLEPKSYTRLKIRHT